MSVEQKPTVFIFTTSYHPFIGGAEIAVQEVARRLAGDFGFFIFTARLRRDLARREERPEGTIIRVGVGSAVDKWLFLAWGIFAALGERRRLRGRHTLLWGMDISAGSGVAAVLNFLIPRLPFVLTVQYGYGGERLARGRFGLIGLGFRFMLRRADTVTAISTYLADVARRYDYRRPVEVIPNGVSMEQFRAAVRERKVRPGTTVITVSRLVPKNGVDTLIRAIAAIKPDIPGISCHILGDGPERPALEALARSLKVEQAIQFFGSVPYEAVPQYLAMADIFVRPSRSEGMGNAFVEALASGLPIIGTPVGGISDIIQDGKTGLFCRVDDPADLAEKILRLIKDRALADRVVGNGQRMVRERFSWDGIAAAYGRLFYRAMAVRILIATPMLPPDIGGPGTYAERLRAELERRGHEVSILSYGSGTAAPASGTRQVSIPLQAPLLIRHLRYAWAAWRLAGQCDVALVLDPVAVGWPLAVACRLRRKTFLLRVEGDALWERYTERTGDARTLRQFYGALPHLSLDQRERAWRRAGLRVFPQAARIVFSSPWRREIFKLGYPLRREQAVIIASPWPKAESGRSARDRVLVFAGRFVRVKNLPRLIRVFSAVVDHDWRLELIGEGPERQILESVIQNLGLNGRIAIRPPLAPDELRRRIARAHAFVLPSLSDVSPNVILDCIATGTPFLLTRETGFYETLKDVGLFVDPMDEDDSAAKLQMLLDPVAYASYRERLAKFSRVHSWEHICDEWLDIIHATP